MMPAEAGLHLEILTPTRCALALELRSLRVPVDSGQVGLRPGGEPVVLPLEPGLVLLRTSGALHFVATAGGLLRSDGHRVQIATPLAVEGREASEVLRQLEEQMAVPSPELELRRAIDRLQAGVLRQLREGGGPAPRPGVPA